MSLELKRACKSVARHDHLRDLSLEFAAGSFNVLLGPALAGKTSLLRLIAGLDTVSSGQIILHGEDITTHNVQQRNMAFVYQEFVNYPTLTVYENIASPLTVQRKNKQTIESRVMEIAKLLGLLELLNRKPTELSGGQQQRVAIGRALAKDADVILLDEPLANLDYKLREDLRRELPRLLADRDKIVLYATTDPAEAFLLGGQTHVLDQGAVQQLGTASEIFSAPANLAVASILSDVHLNQLPAKVGSDRCEIDAQTVFELPPHMRALPAGDYRLGFRAEHVYWQAPPSTAEPYDVNVSVAEMTGSETIVHFDFGGQPCVAIVNGTQPFDADRKTRLFIDLEQLFVFDRDGKTVASPAVASGA